MYLKFHELSMPVGAIRIVPRSSAAAVVTLSMKSFPEPPHPWKENATEEAVFGA